jgi:hypothetical protein
MNLYNIWDIERVYENGMKLYLDAKMAIYLNFLIWFIIHN